MSCKSEDVGGDGHPINDSSLGKTNKLNEDALRALLHDHLTMGIESIAPHFLHVAPAAPSIQACATRTALLNNTEVLAALARLREIETQFTSINKRDELAMYGPLSVIFDSIISNSTAEARRKFHKTSTTAISPGTTFPAFPNRSPDFLLVDHGFQAGTDKLRWHRAHAIVEVKCAAADGPPCSATMIQIADEARLHMNAHPFRLFSLVLIIHGNRFSVAVVDRAGVICSPEMVVYDDYGLTSTFIDAVQQLSSGLNDHQLGLDPTAQKEPSTTSNVLPTYRIQPLMTNNGASVTTDVGELVTDAEPIWQSMSLFGRGSAVWRVSAADAGQVLVMKTAWRHRERTPEFVIYQHLERLRVAGKPGIAVFVTGGDVVLEGQTAVSVNALRPAEAHISGDIALHRVILSSNGKPLWAFEDESEFLRGLLAIMKGISALDERGITHRDISAGNVLLSVHDPRPGYEGFITDFEFANFPDAVLETPRQRPGPAMTGTLQYMAIEILKHLVKAQSRTDKPAPVVHATRHDLESLVYVMVYAAYRRVYTEAHAKDSKITAAQRQLFLADFEKFFGDVNPASVHEARQSMINRKDVGTGEPLRDNVFYHLPLGVETICSMFVERVRHQNPAFAYTTITQARANDPRMALVLQEFPDRFVIEAPHTPVIPLTCKDMLDDVQRLIKVFCQNPPVAPAA